MFVDLNIYFNVVNNTKTSIILKPCVLTSFTYESSITKCRQASPQFEESSLFLHEGNAQDIYIFYSVIKKIDSMNDQFTVFVPVFTVSRLIQNDTAL